MKLNQANIITFVIISLLVLVNSTCTDEPITCFLKVVENSSKLNSWTSNTPICSWQGITCDDEQNPTVFSIE